MGTVVGITLVKRMAYRGDATEEYANTYHLTGDVPADPTAWKALADALIAQEKTMYPNNVSTVRAYGYDSDADNAASVWTWDYLLHGTTVPGTLPNPGGAILLPGDDAVWVRWKTSRNNTKGKPIYLRKYYHGVWTTGGDSVLGGQRTALINFGTKMFDGTFLSARTIRSQKHDETIVSSDASLFTTTRTLKRRGKRP